MIFPSWNVNDNVRFRDAGFKNKKAAKEFTRKDSLAARLAYKTAATSRVAVRQGAPDARSVLRSFVALRPPVSRGLLLAKSYGMTQLHALWGRI